MKDADIRSILHQLEIPRVCLNEPDSLVIDELGIMEGAFRVDVAVVNGKLHGYEIKSAKDNLDRLAAQQCAYNKVFDKLTLVVDERHVENAVKLVPPCWGLMVAGLRNGSPYLDEIWPARLNFDVDPYVLCQLLWREEALALLRKKKLSLGLWHKPRKVLWRKLANCVEKEELKTLVRSTLKARTKWGGEIVPS